MIVKLAIHGLAFFSSRFCLRLPHAGGGAETTDHVSWIVAKCFAWQEV